MRPAALILACALAGTVPTPGTVPTDTRPWTYWWWMGSAVTAEDLGLELERFAAAGLGGVHIIPIYGAKGYESRSLEYLGPAWMAALDHVLKEAARLGLGVDMTTGTGWCFGGPTITDDLAAARLVADAHDATPGVPLRAAYHGGRLDALVAVNTDDGRRVDLRERLANGRDFEWMPPAGRWRVYALSSRPSIKVKRAAPGGEGWMLDPFSRRAVDAFLAPFSAAFDARAGSRPRAMYHDSFEYGADWSRGLLDAFARRRGYRLEDEIAAFVDGVPEDRAARVKHDYRQTLDELLVEDAFPAWTAWVRGHGMSARNEAHGAPANLLDFYALADVPETEMFRADRDTRVSRVAASAAHVEGRRLVAAETGTWIAEHFHETLAGLKDLVDQLFVAGVNHVFYHGAAYSPREAAWPGWVFYASTQMNPRNAIWRDVPALNAYIARVQSVLRAGAPDADVLLYWPIHDLWHDARGTALPLTIHAPGWMDAQPVGRAASTLDALGIAYDFVSDRQLARASAREGGVHLPGGSYRAVLVPRANRVPEDTMARLFDLARGGATVVFEDRMPADVPGLAALERRRATLARLLADVRFDPAIAAGLQSARLGAGRVLVGPIGPALEGVPRESFTDAGLEFVRRRDAEGRRSYFVANRGRSHARAWVRLAHGRPAVTALDPMSGEAGAIPTRAAAGGGTEVFVSLLPGRSIVLHAGAEAPAAGRFSWWRPAGPARPIAGPWQLRFIEGGPVRPAPRTLAALGSWTDLGDPDAVAFGGTAVYQATFDAPGNERVWLLDLGSVHESARVRINGRDAGTLLGPSYQLRLDGLRATGNVLEIEVTSLSANRLRDLDRRAVAWRVFHDINVVNVDYQPLDASAWEVLPSGLLGPVTVTPAVEDLGG